MSAPGTIGTAALLFEHLAGRLDQGASAGLYSFDARFADAAVRLRFHGFPEQAVPTRALSPAPSGSRPVFTIDAIDGAAAAIQRPRLAWVRSDFGPKRVVPGWSEPDLTTYLLRGEGGVAVANWPRRRAIVWMPSHLALPWYERAAPFRWLFDGLAERSGLSTLHAAAVGLDGAGLLLAGPGGAGKSTLALAAVGQGFDYVGDDYCLIAKQACDAFALYSSAKWKKDSAVSPAWLDELSPRAFDGADQKNVIFLNSARPSCLVDRLSIRAVVVPQAGAMNAALETISPQVALRALASSTLAQSEASGAASTGAIAHIVRAVPAYRLSMTRNLDSSVAKLRVLLDGARE